MKHFLKYTTAFIVLLFIFSCTSKEKKKKTVQEDEKMAQKELTYSTVESGTSILWTAYKFTDKLGVSGTFDLFELNLKNESGSIERLLENAEISITTSSVNSGNIIRDPKLRASFFKVFHTDTILGKILDAEDGKGVLELKMNDIANDVAYTYSLKNDTLFLITHVNVPLWNGQEALDSLNKECNELHTGTDGISKLWPDVDVVLKLPIKKTSLSD